MQLAIIADVHANLPALRAVLLDIRRREVGRIACLGDLVGYNTFARETLALMRQEGIASVQGNHDLMAVGELEPTDCGPNARAAIAWTREVLSEDEQAYLRDLPPYLAPGPRLILIHSCLGDPCARLRWPAEYLAQREVLRRFAPALRLCFTGHSHIPQVTEIDAAGAVSVHHMQRMRLRPTSFYFINPGSVGHPRRSDYRASYAIYDVATDDVTFRRVPYDRAAMQRENARHQVYTELGPAVATYRFRCVLDTLRAAGGIGARQ